MEQDGVTKMRKYEKIKETIEKEICTEVSCDLCGKTVKKYIHCENTVYGVRFPVDWGDYHHLETMEICFRSGDNCDVYEFRPDICHICVRDKVLPVFKLIGLKTEWEHESIQ